MFESIYSEEFTKLLDKMCFAFLRDVSIFDEILFVKEIEMEYLAPLYDFSYRSIELDNISRDEINDLEIFTAILDKTKWTLIHTAGGTNFDAIGKISPNTFVCFNNTKMNFEEMKKIHGESYVDSFNPMIDLFIQELFFLLEIDDLWYKFIYSWYK